MHVVANLLIVFAFLQILYEMVLKIGKVAEKDGKIVFLQNNILDNVISCLFISLFNKLYYKKSFLCCVDIRQIKL